MARVVLPKLISVNRALENMGYRSGHSGNGWSINSAFLQCKRKYKLLTTLREEEEGPDAQALEIGIVLHWLLEGYYGQMLPPGIPAYEFL
jgi:hypothetical protein